MLQSGKTNSHTEVERCKFSQEQRKTKSIATDIGCSNILQSVRQEYLPHIEARKKNKFLIPTEYCHQPIIEAQKNKFLYLHVTDLDVFRLLSPTAYRSNGKINSHTYK
jgi:hypothetical protein